MVETAFTWLVSGAIHMVVGGYVCYRFRVQIDKARVVVEPILAAVYHKVVR